MGTYKRGQEENLYSCNAAICGDITTSNTEESHAENLRTQLLQVAVETGGANLTVGDAINTDPEGLQRLEAARQALVDCFK